MLFRQRKPRKFNYKARRLSQTDDKISEDLKFQWQTLRGEQTPKKSRYKTLIILLVALGMIIVLWYLLGNYQN